MIRHLMILLLCAVYISLYSQQPAADSCDYEYKKALVAFDNYHVLWQKDSFGRNGVRFILANEFFRKSECFKGKSWSPFKAYLGEPLRTGKARSNAPVEKGQTAYYRYPILIAPGEYRFYNAGNQFLDISVVDGTITKISFFEMDG